MLVLRTANCSSVDSSEVIGLAALKPPMDFCRHVLGRKPGRVTAEEVTIFDSDGLAVQDVVCALYVYEKAREHKLGTYVDFGLAEVPYA